MKPLTPNKAMNKNSLRPPSSRALILILLRSMLHALLGLGISLLAPATFAQTWQTADDFQYVAGQPAVNVGLTVAPSGMLFASGWGNDAAGVSHGLVMASSDAGNTSLHATFKEEKKEL